MVSKKPRARFCNTNCRDSFKGDRAHGLIYQARRTSEGSYSAERWSLVSCTCAYCGAEVPGRPFDLPPNWPAKEVA